MTGAGSRINRIHYVLVLLAITTGGCTLIGLGIGAEIDARKHDVEVAGWQFQEVKPGTKLDLILKDGATVSGTYEGRGDPDATNPSSAPIPADSRIRLLVNDKKLTFATDDVVLVRIRAKKSGARSGALTGLVIDTALVVAVLTSGSQDTCGDPRGAFGCGASCPFAYSYDGHGYTLEAEMFGGAIFQASQRTDRVRFERLVARDGEYRIQLANHHHEIQEVDRVRLLVVDHPEGAEILPTFEGELVSFARRLPPVRAEDLRGANVISLVRDDDGMSWTSTPFGRDPLDPAQIRDGLVLEFPRSPDSASVKLAFTVQSTEWAAGLLNTLIGLRGRDVEAWRDRMNAHADERIAFLGALRREGLLHLSVWDGRAWRESGVLASVGPGAPRRQAVRVDLRGISGSTVRVRLDATPGLWTVDAVAADYSADFSSSVRELEPVRATSHDGRDLRAALAVVDGVYYTMPTTSDSAELVFAEPPPPAPGQHRSFIFEANGYYSILVPPDEPRLALFDELVSTPGAVARYSLGLAAEELAHAQARLAADHRRGPGDPRKRER